MLFYSKYWIDLTTSLNWQLIFISCGKNIIDDFLVTYLHFIPHMKVKSMHQKVIIIFFFPPDLAATIQTT